MTENTLTSPWEELFPNRRRWNAAQCHHLMEIGELPGRWELFDGEVLSKVGQKPEHSLTLILVAEWLVTIFGFRRVRTQLPMTIVGEVRCSKLDGVTEESRIDDG